MPLISHDNRENFHLDITRGRIVLSKVSFQNRARQIVVLLRLDLDGAPHTNPDGSLITGPHLHRYREGYGDKWAEEVGPNSFPALGNDMAAYERFLDLCNVAQRPILQMGLF